MDTNGFVRTLNRFGNIYDSGREHQFIDWFREWFKKGSADNNLYIKVTQDSILLIEVYVDDIIFRIHRSIDDKLSQTFAKDMQRMNLKCHYLENYPSFWVFRYVKATKEFLFLKLSISEKC
jgi:hypothetical protein